jgi:hypothetical protein
MRRWIQRRINHALFAFVCIIAGVCEGLLGEARRHEEVAEGDCH